jgi:hypothetical protein
LQKLAFLQKSVFVKIGSRENWRFCKNQRFCEKYLEIGVIAKKEKRLVTEIPAKIR